MPITSAAISAPSISNVSVSMAMRAFCEIRIGEAEIHEEVCDALEQEQQTGEGNRELDRPDRRIPERSAALVLQQRRVAEVPAEPDQCETVAASC